MNIYRAPAEPALAWLENAADESGHEQEGSNESNALGCGIPAYPRRGGGVIGWMAYRL
jgi:hypothetical protein